MKKIKTWDGTKMVYPDNRITRWSVIRKIKTGKIKIQ